MTPCISNNKNSKRQAVGFLKDIRRINVAVTRAKDHVFVIANGKTLSKYHRLKPFVEYLKNPDTFTADMVVDGIDSDVEEFSDTEEPEPKPSNLQKEIESTVVRIFSDHMKSNPDWKDANNNYVRPVKELEKEFFMKRKSRIDQNGSILCAAKFCKKHVRKQGEFCDAHKQCASAKCKKTPKVGELYCKFCKQNIRRFNFCDIKTKKLCTKKGCKNSAKANTSFCGLHKIIAIETTTIFVKTPLIQNASVKKKNSQGRKSPSLVNNSCDNCRIEQVRSCWVCSDIIYQLNADDFPTLTSTRKK